MDETVVRLARAFASPARLGILSHLAPHDELAPTVLAAELGVPLNTLSTGLRIPPSVGLIRGRRSGAPRTNADSSLAGNGVLGWYGARTATMLSPRPIGRKR